MSVSTQQYANFSSDSYEPRAKYEEVTLEGTSYQVLEHFDNKRTGYQGTIYQQLDTGEIVVAHRGTEFDRELLKDAVQADGGMVFARSNLQAGNAIELTRRALEHAERNEKGFEPPPQVTVTGHSLGGCLAQITAHYFDLKGETFNPYGAVSLNRRIPEGYDSILNHVMAGDGVSSASPHYGQVRVYTTPKEIGTLTNMGYENNRNPLDIRSPVIAAAALGDSHRMHNFLGVDGDGKADRSVLDDPRTRQLAAQFDPMIDKFRSDIGLARSGATVVSRGPLAGLEYGIDRLRGPLEPGEPAAREERAAAAAAAAMSWQESRGIAAPFGPLSPRAPADPPYVPESLKPNGVLGPLPDYLNPSGIRTQIPMKPGSGPDSASLNDNPSAFLDRMLAAAQSDDRDTFRQFTRHAADLEPGRTLRAEAVATVDRNEQVAAQQLAAQQQMEQQTAITRSGQRMM